MFCLFIPYQFITFSITQVARIQFVLLELRLNMSATTIQQRLFYQLHSSDSTFYSLRCSDPAKLLNQRHLHLQKIYTV